MTILGKILAVVNLVLSLGVGAFIIMTYVARTNWHAAYENVQKQQQVSQADASAFKKEAEEARGQRADFEKQLAEQKQTTAKEQFALNSQINDLGEKLKRAGEEIGKHVAALSAANDELGRRGKEVDHLRSLAVQRDDDLKRKEKQVVDMRAAMVEATINHDAERARNERLLQENERLVRENRQRQQAPTSTSLRVEAAKKNPPSEDIEGRVTKTDSQSGYVTLSVGS